MTRPALLTALASSFFSSGASAQTRPDFSGEWVRADSAEQRSLATVGDAGFRVGTMGTGWGSPLTLRQEANRLVVEYAFFATYDLQPRLRFAFVLDGSESLNTIMIGHTESTLRSRASWRDSTLVITTIFAAPPGVTGPTEVRQAIKLQSPTRLAIETTRPGTRTSGDTTRTLFIKR